MAHERHNAALPSIHFRRMISWSLSHLLARAVGRNVSGFLQSIGAKKSTQTFFAQSFSTTLRVMDVRAENRGRPHQKVRFPAAPVVGRNFLTPGHSGVRVRNSRGESGPKSLCLCCFSSPQSNCWRFSLGIVWEVQNGTLPEGLNQETPEESWGCVKVLAGKSSTKF